jgi:quercetin dioxygenase-like cupin family protein
MINFCKPMHYVSKIDHTRATTPKAYIGHSTGFSRAGYVDRGMGSVHMGVGICSLAPGGFIERHMHSFEESFYILEGSVRLEANQRQELGPGHFGLLRTGTPHAWSNAGHGPVRWLEMQAPQPRPGDEGAGGPDTFFVSAGSADGEALLGYFDESQLPQPGGASQMEGFNPTTGVAIKMFVDRSFGAIHQSLFLIQYMPGAKIDPHDHTFEESYLIVGGKVHAMADGASYELGPGDVIWTGVGCVHTFANLSAEPVRWIETQAPLPPAKEIFRFERDWARLP